MMAAAVALLHVAPGRVAKLDIRPPGEESQGAEMMAVIVTPRRATSNRATSVAVGSPQEKG